jgi:lipopolysaccharide/colanic/teichoic acid biosynthesis glycosyltransferase
MYLHSAMKRTLDLAVALPGSLLALPLVGALAASNRIAEPRQPAFFVQHRAGHGGTLTVVKLRSMTPRHPSGHRVETALARFMRRHYLDELPQLGQVVLGQLTVVGIRVLPLDVYRLLHETWSPRRFGRWSAVYESTPLGLTGLHQVYRQHGKDDLFRFHRDVFYADHASLGLDLYLIWRTIRCIGRLPG